MRRRTIHLGLPSQKTSVRSRKQSKKYVLPKFFTFWPLGANTWAKVPQKGRRPGGLQDLPFCKISLLYDNPRLRYVLLKFLRTNKQKNKYASCPDWRISPHADRIADRRSPRNTNSFQHWGSSSSGDLFLKRARRSGKFVAPGDRASNVLSIFQFLTLGACTWA